ncbi:unnamed protein product, partial [Mesorhabditis belari]|uniref:Uncharacterized protein n=1 Tax=Mesorhabditis belari TaxID=2138241 RepID=A0AAF3EAN1_9BILA
MTSETLEATRLFQHFAKIEMSEEIEKLKEEIKLMNEDRMNLETLLEDELPDYSEKNELHVKKDIFKLEHKLRKLRKKYPRMFVGENMIDVEEEEEEEEEKGCCSSSDNVPCEWQCVRVTCQTLNASGEMR